MVVHVLDEGGDLLDVANLHCQCAQRLRGSRTRNPAQQRLQEERFVGRAPLRRAGPAQHIVRRRTASFRSPAREEAFRRVQGKRDAVGVGHIATLLQRGAIGALGLHCHSGLQITAAKPQAGGAPFPRRARDVQRVAVGRGRRGGVVLPELARFAFALRAHELRRGRRGRAAVFPRQDHAVLHHRSDEDDGRVRRKASARLADEAVDLLQAKGLQTGRQFPAQLVERFAPLLCCAPLRQLVLLPNDAEDQQDDRCRGNQDGGEEERDSTRTPAVIRGTHARYSRSGARAGVVMKM